MRRKRPVHVSGRMKRSYRRAVLASIALAILGFGLVDLALRVPRPPPPPVAPQATPASCMKTLAHWKALEAELTKATAVAADFGARCRLLTCPELDCKGLQDLRSAVTLLSNALAQIVANPAGLAQSGEPKACTAVVAPLAERLAPGLSDVRQALDLCGVRAICNQLRQTPVGEPDVGAAPAQIHMAVRRIEDMGGRLALAESALVKVKLDLTQFVAGDAIEVAVDPSGNRCLAQGGVLEIYPDDGMGRLMGQPLTSEALTAPARTRLFVEAPATPGSYLVAVMSNASSQFALGTARFLVEAPEAHCHGFSGRWATDRGILSASVRQGILRGTYEHSGAVKPGFLKGRVKGRHFHGNWTSELGAGGVHFVLTDHGRRFVGTVGDKLGAEDGAGLWRGTCLSSRPQKSRNK